MTTTKTTTKSMTKTTTKTKIQTILAAIRNVTVAALIAVPAPAFAAELERVEGQVRENIPAGGFLAAAYGIIWAGVLVYVAMVARRLARVQGEIAELRAKVDAGQR